MRFCNAYWIGLAAAWCGWCQDMNAQAAPALKQNTPPPTRLYFAGAAAISNRTNLARVQEILSAPESIQLRNVAFDKLASFYQPALRDGTNSNEVPALAKSLLNEVWDGESFLEVGGREPVRWVLGLKLPSERLGQFETNLRQLLAATTFGHPKPLSGSSLQGWQTERPSDTNFLTFVRFSDHLVLAFSQQSVATDTNLFSILKRRAPGAGDDAFLALDSDSLQLPLGLLPPTRHLRVTLSAHNGRVRTEGSGDLAKPAAWSFEPWTIPTNTIREPLVAFTAFQGLRSWMAGLPVIKSLRVDPAPNQFFTWSVDASVFSIYGALPVAGVTNVLGRFASDILPGIATNDAVKEVGGRMIWVTNLAGVFWHDLPYIVPFLRPGQDSHPEFAVAGLFDTDSKQPPPLALLDQVLTRTNLLYYDWEVAPARLPQWEDIAKMVSALTWRSPRPPDRPAEKWLSAIGPKLGNTITELSAFSPTRVSLVRRSELGLSSLELVLLARWIESYGFPHFTADTVLEPKSLRPPGKKTEP